MDFLQKPLEWFSSFYIRVQSKICGRNSFLIFLFRLFFGFWAKIFSDFRRKIFKKLSKLTSAWPEEQFIAWKIFLKVLNRFGFSAETFGMVLKFLYTCPEWKLRKKQFSYFSFQNFFGFWAKFFRLLAKKVQEIVKTTFFVSRRTLCAFKFFLKSFEPFWIFCRDLWHGSQNSIYVSRVKFAEEKVFFHSSFLNFSGFWAKIFSDFRRKIFKKLSKLPSAWPEEQFVAWNIF